MLVECIDESWKTLWKLKHHAYIISQDDRDNDELVCIYTRGLPVTRERQCIPKMVLGNLCIYFLGYLTALAIWDFFFFSTCIATLGGHLALALMFLFIFYFNDYMAEIAVSYE